MHRRVVVPRRPDGEDAQQHQGPGARLRRAQRQAALDVQHDSASRRVRQRHVGEGVVGEQRQHRRLDADHGRRRARPRLPADRRSDVGSLRRPSSRQQPVRRQPGVRRPEDRPDASGTSRSCITRSGTTTCRPRRCWSTSSSTASRSRPSRRRPSRACSTCSTASPAQPVWPIEERPVPQTDVPGEKTSPTQPFPTKPPAYSRNGVLESDLIDFTPELKAAGLEASKRFRLGPVFNAGRSSARSKDRSARSRPARSAAASTGRARPTIRKCTRSSRTRATRASRRSAWSRRRRTSRISTT